VHLVGFTIDILLYFKLGAKSEETSEFSLVGTLIAVCLLDHSSLAVTKKELPVNARRSAVPQTHDNDAATLH